MTIQTLRDRNLIIFECISGSRAYGADLPTSDTDIRGVFILPQNDFYGLHYTDQVNDPTNDVIFYELRRFVELLAKKQRQRPTVRISLNCSAHPPTAFFTNIRCLISSGPRSFYRDCAATPLRAMPSAKSKRRGG